jgi:hypothetical protein
VARPRVVTVEEYRALVYRAMLEDELLTRVLEYAKAGGWRAFHVRDSKRGVIQGPGAEGFPDLVLVGGSPERIVYRELKSEIGRLSADQKEWGRLLLEAGQDWAVWRPSDLPLIELELTGAGGKTRS